MKEYNIIIYERKEIIKVEKLLGRINKIFRLDEVKYINFIIAVTEALINAVVHGNKNDPDKKVDISINHNNKRITIEIKDEGKGFVFDSVPDPTNKENLLKEHGRGLFIIKSLVDEFECISSGEGTTMILTMIK